MPPAYFKCCKLLKYQTECIELEFVNWPTAVMADGCSSNVAANNKITELLGILSPSLRCVVHAADGSMKRMVNSKTMNVQDITDFVPTLRVVLRHFQLSGKSTALLNEALDVLDMKSIHMMTFCPTRMSYILSASAKTVALLVPVCDVLATANIKPEERSSFMSPKFMIILHLLADFEDIFLKYYLKILDAEAGLIISAYHISSSFVQKISDEFTTTLTQRFLDCLREDENGNIVADLIVPNNTKHTILLNHQHRPSRNQAASKVEIIKNLGQSIKVSIIENMIQNITDQSQSETLVEYASAFDMRRRIGLEERIQLLKKLHTIYGTNYVHNVPHNWEGKQITIFHRRKLNCTEDEIVKEFSNIWPVFNRIWPQYSEDVKGRHINFFTYIISHHSITHPNICELIRILMSVCPSTGPLERSYSKLAKICYKDRNQLSSKNLETLYLLSLLKEYNIDYDKAIKLLEK